MTGKREVEVRDESKNQFAIILIAAGVQGVKSVKNNLIIRGEGRIP